MALFSKAATRRLAPWVALAVLAGASVLAWNRRFEALPVSAINGDAGFGRGLEGWQKNGGSKGLRVENGKVVARFANPVHDEEFRSASFRIEAPTDLRFAHVRVDAKWDDAVTRPLDRTGPRLALIPSGSHPYHGSERDRAVFQASGTRDWHREEAVFALDPDAQQRIGLHVQMIGWVKSLELRDLRITAVRTRPWVPAIVAVLLIGWVGWAAWRWHGARCTIRWRRALPAGVILVAGAWFLFVPTRNAKFSPLLGGFSINVPEMSDSPPPELSAPSENGVPNPPPSSRQRIVPTGQQPTNSANSDSATTSASKPKSTQPPRPPPRPATTGHNPPPPPHPTFEELLRGLDFRLDLVHIGIFFGLALAVFLAAGSTVPWRLLTALALLSEAIPAWHEQWFDLGDPFDLLSNLSGLALAAACFHWLTRRFQQRSNPPGENPA